MSDPTTPPPDTPAFRDTEPAPLPGDEALQRWAEFRVTQPQRILAALRDLCTRTLPLTLGPLAGTTVKASIWSVDGSACRVHLGLHGEPQALQQLAAADSVWAAAYLDNDKVQFALGRFELQLAGEQSALHAPFPDEIFRLPRRRAVRVRRHAARSVLAELDMPGRSGRHGEAEVLDLDARGCALRLGDHAWVLRPGSVLEGVTVWLDPQTPLVADLEVQHLSPVAGQPGSVRVGCGWKRLAAPAQATLAAWLRGGQSRRHLMTLSLD